MEQDEKPKFINIRKLSKLCTVNHQHRGSEFPVTGRAQPGLGRAWWGYWRVVSQSFFFPNNNPHKSVVHVVVLSTSTHSFLKC